MRLCDLAKAYLEQLRADVEEEDGAADGASEDDDARAVITKKLRQDVQEVMAC